MQKTISILIILSFAVLSFGPDLIFAEDETTPNPEILEQEIVEPVIEETETKPIVEEETTQDFEEGFIETAFTENQNESIASEEVTGNPVVKAIFSMQDSFTNLLGTDNNSESGTQFLPSGIYQVSKPISVCAVVYDANGLENINSVSSKVYYPMANFGPDMPDSRIGCGQEMGAECQMTKLAKEDGQNLFCNTIQNNNSSIVSFYDMYGFSNLCGDTQELQTETAGIFCCDRELLYNDIAGDYKISASSEDKEGLVSNVLDGTFSYLELTAFESDFSKLNYGSVSLNSKKTIEGDLIWDEPLGENNPTIRNVGNTRLQMTILQNDMGLGKTEENWNIRYETKVGQESLWQNYWPKETALLKQILNISKTDQINFSIEVLNFPVDDTADYFGKMVLKGQKVEDLSCEAI